MTARLSHQPGDFIGPGRDQYRVMRLIKSGGMGSVYEVENTMTGNRYAVKECDVMDDPRGKQISRRTALDSFLREAGLLETLKHPHIPAGFLLVDKTAADRRCGRCGNQVPDDLETCAVCQLNPDNLYYQPVTAQGRYYLFMDYIDGTDSSEFLSDPNHPQAGTEPERLLHWMAQIASVLESLHQSGLIHRDVKPDNIRIGADDKAYLLDMGLLRKENADPDQTDRNTRNLGTEGYAPPEQAQGNPCAQSDVYACAMTFLHLASGMDPTNPVTQRDILAADPAVLVPTLDRRTADVLRTALHKDPQARPSSQDLHQAFLQAKPVSAVKATHPNPMAATNPPHGGGPTNPMPGGRNKMLWILAATAGVTLLLLLFIFRPDSSQTFEVTAKAGAVVFTHPEKPRVGQTLKGGEILKVEHADPEQGANLLRVLEVDGKRKRGYLRRDKVFRKRE